MRVLQWTLLPNLLIIIFRTLLTALGRPGATLVVTVIGLFVNALLNWMLDLRQSRRSGARAGRLGLREPVHDQLHGAGAGVLCCHASAHPALPSVRPDVSPGHAAPRRDRPHRHADRPDDGVRSARCSAPRPISWAGSTWPSVAAHAVALQIAAITFMVPFGLSQATVIRVGLAYGARDRALDRAAPAGRAGRWRWASWRYGAADVAVPARACRPVPRRRRRPTARHVLDLAVSFLAVAALFQLVDGAQVVGSGMLRGLHDTRVPMISPRSAIGWSGSASAVCWPSAPAGAGSASGSASPLGLGVVAVLMIGRWSLRDGSGLVAAA